MSVTAEQPPQEDVSFATKIKDRGLDVVRRSGRVLGAALLAVVAVMWLRGMTSGDHDRPPYGSPSFEPGFLLAIGLVGAGLLLLRGQQPVGEETAGTRVERPRSPLGILTLSAVFLVDGFLLLLGNLGAADITIAHIAATSLLLIGLGLLVGAWWGRSRLLIVVGMLMVPILIVSGFMHFPLRGAIGFPYLQPRSLAAVADDYDILAGGLTLDLMRVKEFPAQKTIDFEVAAGDVTIYVPERVSLSIRGDIEWGNVTIGRGRQDGEDLRFETDFAGKPGAGQLSINFHGGIARLYVERISRSERFGPPEQRKNDRRRDRKDGREGDRQRGERRDKEERRKSAKT